MVIDTSVLVAILTGEPEMVPFMRRLEVERTLQMSAATLVETTAVMLGRSGERAVSNLNDYIEAARIDIVPVTISQARLAQQAYMNYGKGRHAAALNFGDCFAYALAKESGEALFHKGNDFNQKDIKHITLLS